MEAKIKLNHDVGFMEDDKLDLSYIHTPLSQKVYEEIQRRKASKIALSTVFLSFPVESVRTLARISVKGVSFNTVL